MQTNNKTKPVIIHIGTRLADARRKIVLRTLAALGDNQTHTAAMLGVSRVTLRKLLKQYGYARKIVQVPRNRSHRRA